MAGYGIVSILHNVKLHECEKSRTMIFIDRQCKDNAEQGFQDLCHVWQHLQYDYYS